MRDFSGGFGSITLGQIWSAAYNHAGAITDKSYYFGSSAGTYRHGNALSYAFSSGALGFQLDLISDGGTNTGKAIDKTEFGMTIGLGEIGRVAIAHTNMRDTVTAMPTYWVRTAATGNPGGTTEAEMITVYVASTDVNTNVEDGKINAAGDDSILRTGNRYYIGGATAAACATAADNTDATDDCVTATAFVSRAVSDATAGGSTITTTEDYHIEGALENNVVAIPAGAVDKRGHKNTHVAVEFSVGGFTPYVGYSKMKKNGATKETKTTHYGVSGGLGDTGVNYLVAVRNVKDEDKGMETTPWLVNVSKSLGGGATVIFEHGNDDNDMSGKSRVGLHVTF